MALAVLLPRDCVDHLRRLVPAEELLICSCWDDLDSALGCGLRVALFDPTAPQSSTTEPHPEKLLGKYPAVTFVAYVTKTPQNLHAVFRLSKAGLQYVFAHPVRPTDARFLSLLEKVHGTSLALLMMDAIEEKLAHLPSQVRSAVGDLFERPHRYATGRDLADEAGVGIQNLYERFSSAGIRTPKELVLFAKTVHAYCYLRFSKKTPQSVAKALGYSDTGRFSRYVAGITGCRLVDLRDGIAADEIVVRFLEWLYKPSALHTPSSQTTRHRTRLPRGPRSTTRRLLP